MATVSFDNDFEQTHKPHEISSWEEVQGLWDIQEYTKDLNDAAHTLYTKIEESTARDVCVCFIAPKKHVFEILREFNNRGIPLQYIDGYFYYYF